MRKSASALLLSVLFCTGAAAQNDYTDGAFIVNEDWYGHNNSSVNFITSSGEWVYRVIQKENSGIQLGGSACFGTIYGGRFYIISKQSKDGAADIQGAQITVCDARTMKVIKQISRIDASADDIEGRSFVAVNNEKAYVGTNNGIYVLDLVNLEITGRIEGTGNSHTDTYGKYFMGQTGTLLRIDEKVYALHQDNGLMVIDAATDKIIKTIGGPDNGSLAYGSAVMSEDGSLWMSVSDKYGRGDTFGYLIRYDTESGDTTRIDMPDGVKGPSNSWYAWTPDGFCADRSKNILYWNSGNGVWYNDNRIYRYDIDGNEAELFIDFDKEDYKVYSSSMRVEPTSGELYVSVFKDSSIPEFRLRRYDAAGNIKADYEMEENYWFPTVPVFPDNSLPVAHNPEPVERSGSDDFVISLDGIAEDADNMSAAMVKTIREITAPDVLEASVKDGSLVVSPLKDGSSTVIIEINSNGNTTTADVAISISGVNGIDDVTAEMRSAYISGGMLHINNCGGYRFAVYDLSGSAIESFVATSDNFDFATDMPSGTYIICGNGADGRISFKVVKR